MITLGFNLIKGIAMIQNVYFTRIVNGEKCYGFGVTESGQNVYIPGHVVENFDLSIDDVGTKNKMALIPDKTGKADHTASALLIEDSALHQAYEWAKEEIERLEGILTENGLAY